MKHTQWRGSPAEPLPMFGPPRADLRERPTLEPRATTRRLFNFVMRNACTVHGKRAGEPCWVLSTPPDRPASALCGKRVALTFHPTRKAAR